MVRDNRRCSTYLFGAICPARGIGAAIISQAVNTAAMNFHLTEIASQVAPGARAVVLFDGAGWHEKAKDLQVPDNITLMTLPPYSPELNSMENVWNYLRDNKRSNIAWDGEAAYLLSPLGKGDLFAGGVRSQRDPASARRGFREALVKAVAGLLAVAPFRGVVLSGRLLEQEAELTEEVKNDLGRLAEVRRLPCLPGAWAKHAAQGRFGMTQWVTTPTTSVVNATAPTASCRMIRRLALKSRQAVM